MRALFFVGDNQYHVGSAFMDGPEPIYKNVSDTLDMYCITQIHNNHTWHVQWQVLLKTLAPSVAAWYS